MIYFDNSATTFYKPPEVINSVTNTLKFLSVNSGRSSHRLAMSGAKLIFNTREKVAQFVNCDSDKVIFTSGCTEALNLAIFGSKLSGNVVTTVAEHNSILRPLNELKKSGIISITYCAHDENSRIKAIKENTCLVAVSHVSNVTGKCIDLDVIGNYCSKKGIKFLVDAAQSLGYKKVDMKKSKITFLASSPHKGLHAMQGIGFLACQTTKLSPLKFGGTGTSSLSLVQPTDMPEGFESGTLNMPGIVSLNTAINYTNHNFEANRIKLTELHCYMIESLKCIKTLKIYSDLQSMSGIISLNLPNYTSMEVADILNEQYDIAVRSGLHCAPLIHKYYGTDKIGMVRISLGIDNSYKEIDFFVSALRELSAF